jgi:hypothetical protein
VSGEHISLASGDFNGDGKRDLVPGTALEQREGASQHRQ